MSILDIILIALIGFGLVRGLFRGLFVEVASLVALVAGVYGAIHFSYFIAGFLETKTNWSEQTINITAFILTFCVIILTISLAGKALTKLANFAMLGVVNKFLGAVFGGLKMALIASILCIILSKANGTAHFFSEEKLNQSVLFKPVTNIALVLFPYLIKAEEVNNLKLKNKSNKEPN